MVSRSDRRERGIAVRDVRAFERAVGRRRARPSPRRRCASPRAGRSSRARGRDRRARRAAPTIRAACAGARGSACSASSSVRRSSMSTEMPVAPTIAPVRVVHGFAAAFEPVHAAVGPHDAVIEVPRDVARHAVVHRRDRALAVVGMEERPVHRHRAVEAAGREPEQRFELLVPVRPRRVMMSQRHVPMPPAPSASWSRCASIACGRAISSSVSRRSRIQVSTTAAAAATVTTPMRAK